MHLKGFSRNALVVLGLFCDVTFLNESFVLCFISFSECPISLFGFHSSQSYSRYSKKKKKQYAEKDRKEENNCYNFSI